MISATQRGVLRGMAIGAASTLALLGYAIASPPARLLPGLLPISALERALAWDVWLVVCLLVQIGMLARHRFFSPEDIDGNAFAPGTPRARALQGALQNTLEQVVLAIPTHLAWAALMPRTWQAALPAAVALFVAGRVLFAWGYARGAPARALGFALTFYPSVGLIALLVWRVTLG